MKVATAEEFHHLNHLAIEEVGIPGIVLMENAGIRVVNAMKERYAGFEKMKPLIVCGKSNNGGIGLVIARHLHNHGIEVRVTLLAEKHQLKGDTKLNFLIAEKINVPIIEITSNEQLPAFRNLLQQADVIVDAILGVGLKEAVQGLHKHVIESMNKSQKPIIAVDIPSGLSADTGVVPGSCVRADLTVTFVMPKRGIVLYPAAEHVGDLLVVDAGIPRRLIEESDISVHFLDWKDVRDVFAPRRANTQKGNYGHILVVAGAPGKSGAAILSGRSALRTGAGLVTLAVPESIYNLLEMPTLEVMTASLPETSKGTLSVEAYDQIMALAEEKRVVALGPGMSTHPSTVELIHRLVATLPIPMVIDADAINAVAQNPDVLLKAKAPLVLTPNMEEMSRLVPNVKIQENRIQIAQQIARKYGVYIALKGARTIIASPHGTVFINSTGNPGMATAGTGDVLTGIIAGLISQNTIPGEATKTGVFLHGLAGDLAAKEKGDYGLIASDLIEAIPLAIKCIQEKNTVVFPQRC